MTKKNSNKKPEDGNFSICASCGKEVDFGEYPFCPHGQTGSSYAQRIDPIVLFKKPDGSYSVPGSNRDRTPEGCERVELRTLGEIRSAQAEMNQRTRDEYEVMKAGEEQHYSEMRRHNRAELRDAMNHMSPRGRALALAAMARTDARPRRSGEPDAFFHVTEYDASNREKQRDAMTGWRGRDA